MAKKILNKRLKALPAKVLAINNFSRIPRPIRPNPPTNTPESPDLLFLKALADKPYRLRFRSDKTDKADACANPCSKTLAKLATNNSRLR